MPVIVVRDEKDLGELRLRVLRPGVTAERRKDVEAQIRAANPHLNLDLLRPGAVVVLPEHPDLAEEVREPAIEDDEELRAEVARLSEAIDAERRRAQEWSEAVAEATQGWERDLAELRRLSG